MSQQYAYLKIGRYAAEISAHQSTNTIKLSLYVKHAASLLQLVARTLQDLIGARFISLECEQLVEVAAGLLVPVAALQDHCMSHPDTQFSVQQVRGTYAQMCFRVFVCLSVCALACSPSILVAKCSLQFEDDDIFDLLSIRTM